MLNRRDFMKTIGLGMLSCSILNSSCQLNKNSWSNIIFILADDLGYGDLGCFGQKEIKTPNLDKMAAEGMRFTQHYAGSTVCAPSRCTLMTGYHTGHARIRGNGGPSLQPNDVTVAKLLKQNGYKTGMIGKWGLGRAGSTGIPNKQGFDYFYGYLSQIKAHNYYPDYLWRNEEKVQLTNKNIIADRGYSKGYGSAAVEKNDYSHDLMTQEASQFVEKNKDNPFFLYLAYTIPHANNEHWMINEHGMEVPDYGQYQEKDWPEPQKGHAAMISRMDRDIGSLFEQLKALGIDGNTIVMFSSDNGPHREGLNDPDFNDSNGPLRGIKRDLYEGGIRVPLIVRWPGKVKAGITSEHVSAFWDFLPTACEIAKVAVPSEVDGLSYLPELTGKSQTEHPFLYWEFKEQGGKQAIRFGNWKAIRLNWNEVPDGPVELYNLSQDLGEKNNVAEQHPKIVKQAVQILENARTLPETI